MMEVIARGARTVGVLLATLALGSCSREKVLERIAPPESQQFVRSLLDSLATAPPEQITRHFTAQLYRQPAVEDSVQSVQRQFAALGDVDSATFIGGTAFMPSGSSSVHRNLSFEVFGEGGIARVQVRLIEKDTLRRIDGLHFEQIPAPLATMHGFWPNMGLVQALVLMVMLGVFGYSLWAAVQVARTRMRWRWVWVLVALLGAGQFGVNWTTGEFFTRLVMIQLLGASFMRDQLLGPWFVTFSIPLGAPLALRRRSRALASAHAEPVTSKSSDSPAAA